MHPNFPAPDPQRLTNGAGRGQTAKPLVMQKTASDTDDTPAPRKRTKTIENEAKDQADETRKRARGRPRLNTQDETAADRRRTQIRLAQRAYRNRKDAAIITLEQKVKDLEEANENMSKAFTDFCESTLTQGLLASAPEAARRLKCLAETFFRLGYKKMSEGKDQSSHTSSPEQHSSAIFDEIDQQESISSSSTTEPSPTTLGAASMAPNIAAPDCASEQMVGNEIADFSQPVMDHTIIPYEVIAQPTPDNASYPFYASVGYHPQHEPLDAIPFPMTFPSLSPPSSYAAHEGSFGRRLHRMTIESGLKLASMPNPPPDQYAAVFGFCLLFENRSDIIKRLSTALSRTNDEGLSYWKAPFTNLGGSGTFFGDDSYNGNASFAAMPGSGDTGSSRVYREISKPQEMTGYSMGPFDARTQLVADGWLDSRTHMLLPGFEGSFFDPTEVEKYLSARGIYIPPRADYVSAEIDFDDFLDPPENDNTYEQIGSCGPTNPRSSAPVDPSVTDHSSSINSIWAAQGPGFAVLDDSSLMAQPTGQDMDGSGFSYPDTGSGPAMFHCPLLSDSRWPQGSTPNKRKVTINVPDLIDEIIGKAVCLGRSPGVRPKHINKALKVAIGALARTQPCGSEGVGLETTTL